MVKTGKGGLCRKENSQVNMRLAGLLTMPEICLREGSRRSLYTIVVCAEVCKARDTTFVVVKKLAGSPSAGRWL